MCFNFSLYTHNTIVPCAKTLRLYNVVLLYITLYLSVTYTQSFRFFSKNLKRQVSGLFLKTNISTY